MWIAQSKLYQTFQQPSLGLPVIINTQAVFISYRMAWLSWKSREIKKGKKYLSIRELKKKREKSGIIMDTSYSWLQLKQICSCTKLSWHANFFYQHVMVTSYKCSKFSDCQFTHQEVSSQLYLLVKIRNSWHPLSEGQVTRFQHFGLNS